MRIDEALKLLGIPDGVPVTVSIVMKAWKRKMLQLHPDKNPSVDANIDTQRAIEAKNTIIEKIKEQQQRKAADAAAAAAAAASTDAFTARRAGSRLWMI
jgi:DnaJ-class molecular chaperone